MPQLQQLTGLDAAFLALEDRLSAIKARLAKGAKQSKLGRLLLEIPGIGPMTAVSLEAAIGDDPGRFASGRQFAAWLGLTPRVSASGERRQLARITKRGSARPRSLLVVCAQAMLRQYRQGRHGDPLACWARHLLARKRWNVAVVALANKLGRGSSGRWRAAAPPIRRAPHRQSSKARNPRLKADDQCQFPRRSMAASVLGPLWPTG